MVDNNRMMKQAFAVCRVQLKENVIYDRRAGSRKVPMEITKWLNNVVSPESVK